MQPNCTSVDTSQTMITFSVDLSSSESIQTAIDFLQAQITVREHAARLESIYSMARSMLKHGNFEPKEMAQVLENIRLEASASF